MLATHRPTTHNSHPPISYPVLLTDFPPQPLSPPLPRSMSIRSHRGRLPSLSGPMSWLNRSSSTSSNTHPTRVPHSKASTIASIKHGNFGSGVTIVRTPQEALVGAGVSVEYTSDQENENREAEQDEEEEEEQTRQDRARQPPSRAEQADAPSVPPAYSPPRSSLPLSKSTPTLPLKDKDARSTRSGRPAPSLPSASETPILLTQKKLPPPPLSTLFPAVPPLPAHLATPPSSPPFDCVLLSPIPPNAIDFSKVLVTLETCTATHRTTFNSLTSRPSHLANYLNSLFSDVDEELDPDSASLGSRAENGSFNSIFHNHLTASGLLSQSAYHIHIFLDRASPS